MPLSSSITWKEVIVVVLSATLAVQQKEFVHKSFGRLKKEKKEDKQNIGKAFLVQLDTGCTGTLIAKDWILTAAHCESKVVKSYYKNENGDYERIWPSSATRMVKKLFGIPKLGGPIKPWREPLGPPHWSEQFNTTGWAAKRYRKIHRVIVHGAYGGDNRSWRGNDLALIQLGQYGQEWKKIAENGEVVVPICLPTQKFVEEHFSQSQHSQDATVAGFGRRENPYCVTDIRGPEAFEICGSPQICNYRSQLQSSCGMDFIYQGKKRQECVMEKPPSSDHPFCQAYAKSLPNNTIERVTHIFWKKDFMVTCYPETIENGWCTTRRMGNLIDSEPSYGSGWGFCSSGDPRFEKCNQQINRGAKDPSDIHVQILSKDYCIESLLDNLKVEQPMQAYAPHNQPLINSTLFCAGYNVSYDFSADHFMRIHKNGLFRRMKATISDELRPYRINGGALCVGDSGGPLWVYNTGKKKMSTQKAVPVQMGVYSFMPWGTCSGAHETSFFGYIPQFLDWIFQYVPEEDVCKP